MAGTDPVFLALWTTGPDPHRDPVYFLEGRAWSPDGGEELVVPPVWLRPERALRGASATARLSELGLPETGLEPPEALPERLRPLAGRRVVLASERSQFLMRFASLLPEEEQPRVVDLESLAAFLHPRRGGRSFQSLSAEWVGGEGPERPSAAELRELAAALVAAHRRRPPQVRQLFARGLDELQAHSESAGAEAWDVLEAYRDLLLKPGRLGLSPAGAGPGEPQSHADDLEQAPLDLGRALREIEPRFAREYSTAFENADPLPTRLEVPLELEPRHEEVLERYFDLLPSRFGEAGQPRPERPGQRALSRAVLQAFSENSFLIADAPTGTGKTLAYLAPLMLLASANRVRIGVSTYTRALQEQAFFREIPRALELLEEAGLPAGELPRVSLLKGRANYVCGRALVDAAPLPGEGSPAARATWLRLALYYCEDPFGDLDGFGLGPGLPLGNPAQVLRRARETLRSVRALPQCCIGKAAQRCAAGVRTLRSDRSHVVVTNHAFVLARPEAFAYLLADECDHLHEVTISARSYEIDLDEVAGMAHDLSESRGRDKAPFARLAALLSRLPPGDVSEDLRHAARASTAGAGLLDAAGLEVSRELRTFQAWKKENAGDLTPEERAFLLHDYLESGRGDVLATALDKLRAAVDTLDSGLRTLIEELGELPDRGSRRLRWSLRRPLDLLDHWREGLDIWLGGATGSSDYSQDLHYEALFENRRRPILVLKWLLPQKWLGEVYYPSLQSATLVSATARVRGSFRPMKGYLGLDIVADEREDRPARAVHEFAGPPTFDARAALVCVPEDAPPYGFSGPQLEGWMSYVEDFLLFLGERTRGRMLGLFTNRWILQRVGERLAPAFAARSLPFYWQGMPGLGKEEIMERFRSQVDSVLFGLDTFWYGVDFPGETCQYLVLTKLPYGQLDDYLYAQRARMGFGPHRNRIYLPKALAMFRQGCGRLLRNEDDRGAVFILDRRVLEKRHADFLAELPGGMEEFEEPHLLVSDSDSCFQGAFRHMQITEELRRLGLDRPFSETRRAMRAEEV